MNDVEDFLAHFGKKGMKWGVRSSRKELRGISKNARGIIKEASRATTNKERQAAANKYQKEVLNKVKSKEFKEKYRAANTMTKGDMATHALLFGPFAAFTIPQARMAQNKARIVGPKNEVALARDILKELREPL